MTKKSEAANVPSAPNIITCTQALVAGTEATANTQVKAYNLSAGEVVVGTADVTNGAWSMIPEPPLTVGDEIMAKAFDISSGVSSPFSNSAYVTSSGSSTPPDKPIIGIHSTDLIYGSEATPGTVVKVFNENLGMKPVTDAPAIVENGSWSLVPDSDRINAGDIIYARAYESDPDGSIYNPSDPSRLKTVVPAEPLIKVAVTQQISGTESTPNSAIIVNNDTKRIELSRGPVSVYNGQWSLIPDYGAISVGDLISAKAYQLVGENNINRNVASVWSVPKAVVATPSIPASPEITVYTTQYLQGIEATPGTVINLYDIKTGIELTKDAPLTVLNGAWSYPLPSSLAAGDGVYAMAFYLNEDGTVSNVSSAPSNTVYIGQGSAVPVPPEITGIDGTTMYGKTLPNTWVQVGLPSAFNIQTILGSVFSSDGSWTLNIGSSSQSSLPFFATAAYPGGGNSERYLWEANQEFPLSAPVITGVTQYNVTGSAPEYNMYLRVV